MKKDKKERSILPGVIIVSLLVAVIVYAVMLNAEKTALSDYEKGPVYVTTKPVPKGTLITADYITQKEGYSFFNASTLFACARNAW